MGIKEKKYKILLKLCFIFLLGGAFVYYFFMHNPMKEGAVFLRCPSNLIFGINCPGCGSHRAIYYLLHFDILEALRYNALLTISFPFILYIGAIWIYNFIFEKQVRIKLFYNNKIVWLLFFVIIIYGILRNIAIYPLTFLSPP